MYCSEITFGSPQYDLALALRDAILREPLDMEFTPEQIAQEHAVHHIGAFDQKNNLVGILIVKPLDDVGDNLIKVRQVAVDAKLQKQGVGTVLMEYTERLFKHRDYKHIELNSRKSAVPFYEKIGYTVVGDEFTEVGIPHLKMTKSLV